ncbi:MAG: sensor histidine kinase N-terminal domain-containing protein [Burkholderiales bacterium]|nr:sensor histidine kinase N-terminal domain-containing protein [Burkholderiales bacterium]
MTSRGWSLRSRLAWLLVGAAALAWIASSVWLYRSSLAQTDRLFDAALVEAAHAVLAVVARELKHHPEDEDEIELEAVDHAHTESIFYQVRASRGEIVFRSPGAPHEPLAAAGASGFADARLAAGEYRVYSLEARRERTTIHVAQPLAVRRQLAQSAALRLLLPGLVLAGVLALGVWLIVRRVTAPVIGFAGAIDARAPGDSAPVQLDGLPAELQPVGLAVNRLFARVDEALQHERTLTADAAHELRTPLAALRAQAQVALRARDEGERGEALQALIGGVDRATRLVEAVLALARLDARSIDRSALPVLPLDRIAAEAVEALRSSPLARTKQLQLDVPALTVRADAESLPIALRNLCENALRHAASRLRIEARAEAGEVTIAVRDDGPGMTEAQRARAFDRFYRGGPDGGGAGLGLALVRRVAEMHGGRVAFTAGLDGKGLGVEMVLPADDRPSAHRPDR